MYERILVWLEQRLFPAVLSYAKHPLTILAELLLIPLLIGFKDAVVFVLVVNSYLNAFANAEGSIMLHNQDQHSEQLDALHEKVDRHYRESHALHAATHAAIAQVKDHLALREEPHEDHLGGE